MSIKKLYVIPKESFFLRILPRKGSHFVFFSPKIWTTEERRRCSAQFNSRRLVLGFSLLATRRHRLLTGAPSVFLLCSVLSAMDQKVLCQDVELDCMLTGWVWFTLPIEIFYRRLPISKFIGFIRNFSVYRIAFQSKFKKKISFKSCTIISKLFDVENYS